MIEGQLRNYYFDFGIDLQWMEVHFYIMSSEELETLLEGLSDVQYEKVVSRFHLEGASELSLDDLSRERAFFEYVEEMAQDDEPLATPERNELQEKLDSLADENINMILSWVCPHDLADEVEEDFSTWKPLRQRQLRVVTDRLSRGETVSKLVLGKLTPPRRPRVPRGLWRRNVLRRADTVLGGSGSAASEVEGRGDITEKIAESTMAIEESKMAIAEAHVATEEAERRRNTMERIWYECATQQLRQLQLAKEVQERIKARALLASEAQKSPQEAQKSPQEDQKLPQEAQKSSQEDQKLPQEAQKSSQEDQKSPQKDQKSPQESAQRLPQTSLQKSLVKEEPSLNAHAASSPWGHLRLPANDSMLALSGEILKLA